MAQSLLDFQSLGYGAERNGTNDVSIRSVVQSCEEVASAGGDGIQGFATDYVT